MSKPKKTFGIPGKIALRDTQIPPDSMGAMRRTNPFHMSLDELIEYRKTGVKPTMIIDEAIITKLGHSGISIITICGLFGISEQLFYNNQTWSEAFYLGRSNLAARNRASIVQHAEEGNLTAAVYIDKIIGGDIEQVNHTFNVVNRPAEGASTEDLMNAIDVQVREIKDV